MSHPPISCTDIGSKKFTTGEAWTVYSSPAAFVSTATGEAIPAGRRFVSIDFRNDDAAETLYIVGRGGMTNEDPTGDIGTIPIPPGESYTLDCYGTGITAVSLIASAPGVQGTAVASCFPY